MRPDGKVLLQEFSIEIANACSIFSHDLDSALSWTIYRLVV